MAVLSPDRVRDAITAAGGTSAAGTAALLHALETAAGDTPPVVAVVRTLAHAGADGHTVLPLGLVTAMLTGQGATPDQATAAVAQAVDAGHVLAFAAGDVPAETPDAPAGDVPAGTPGASPAPGDALLTLADIGMAEESVAESLTQLLATADVRIEDRTHGGDATGPGVVDLRTVDVVAAAALLEQATGAERVVLVADSALPPPPGPGQVGLDLLATAPSLGATITESPGAAGPVIAGLCAAVRRGTLPPVDDPTREVVVVRAADAAEAAHRAAQLITDSLPRALGLSGDDVVVITPVRRGAAGADALRAAGLPAMTVREALGRTWPGVVAVLPPEACGVLSRPLVYAVFSRALKHLSIVHAAGPVLARAVRETGSRPRRTRLPALLRAGT
jgi:exodeoxyribonuclease V alpha subunit